MGVITVLGSLGASVALAAGMVGMAQADPHAASSHDAATRGGHMAGMTHDVDPAGDSVSRLTKQRAEKIWARGGLPRIRGRVDAPRTITISKNSVPAGRYKFVINDATAFHNWHILGDVNKSSTVGGTGIFKWRARLSQGSYTVHCDVHPNHHAVDAERQLTNCRSLARIVRPEVERVGARPLCPDVVVCAAIVRQGTLLAARRTSPVELAGRWELPGGKVMPGESDEDALVREIGEELGMTITLLERVGADWPLGESVLRVWLGEFIGTEDPQPLEQHDLLRWVSPEELDELSWLPADIEPARAALTQWIRSWSAVRSGLRNHRFD